VLAASHELLTMCVRLGGVLSGEHGVGIEKRDSLDLLFGEDDLETMRRVRDCWNRQGLLNPGKILPVRAGCGEPRASLPENTMPGRVAAIPGAWI